MFHLLIVSVIWGFSFVIIKSTLTTLDSNFVSFVRMLLSFLFFLPFIRPSGIRLLDKLQLMLIGGVQFGLMYIAYIAAYRSMPAYLIALFTTTTPLFVTIFNDLHFKKIHKTFFLAALLAVAGGAVLRLPEQPFSASLHGIILLQISNAAFAYGQVAYRRLMNSRGIAHDQKVFGLMYGGGVFITGLFSLATTNFHQLSVAPKQWIALLYLGVIASGLCFFLWNRGARKVDGGTLAIMNNLKIPVGVIASLMILREKTVYPRLLIGCILFAAALWINSRREGKIASLL
jgi:carboxylate/amino acid/amine transporter